MGEAWQMPSVRLRVDVVEPRRYLFREFHHSEHLH